MIKNFRAKGSALGKSALGIRKQGAGLDLSKAFSY